VTVCQSIIKTLPPASTSVSLGSGADSQKGLGCSLGGQSVMSVNSMASSPRRILHLSLGPRALGFPSPTTGEPLAFNALGTLS